MKLYDGAKAPNPRRVRVFLAEKGIEVPLVPVDMMAMEHKGEAIAHLSPFQELPILELDDGTVLSETVAICRYFEELHPAPALMGEGAQGKANVEMWQRRMEFKLLLPVANVFRHTHPAMKLWEIPQLPDFAEANKPRVAKVLEWMNEELAKRPFIAGEKYSIADITAMIAIDFMKPARLVVPDDLVDLIKWYEGVKARPSSSA